MKAEKAVTLRIRKEFLDEVDTIVEGRTINRSDFFGAAVNMLLENPKMAETDLEIVRVDESSLEEALKDRLLFRAVRKLLGGKGLTEAIAIIEKGSLHIEISRGTLVRFKPPTIIEFELTGDFRVQVDLAPGIDIHLFSAGRELPVSEEALRHLGTRYSLLFNL